jgi:hypothetical protein
LAELVLLFGLLIAGFDSMRLIPYFALLVMPAVGPAWRSITAQADRPVQSVESTASTASTESTNPAPPRKSLLSSLVAFEKRAEDQEPHGLKIALGTLALSAIAGAVMMAAPFAQVSDFDAQRLPVQAVQYLQDHHVDGLGFNYDNWGGYIYFKTRRKVFIDDWADFLPVQFLDDYINMLTAKGDWQKNFERYNFQWVMVPNQSQLAQILQGTPEWRAKFKPVYRDNVCVLLSRQAAR